MKQCSSCGGIKDRGHKCPVNSAEVTRLHALTVDQVAEELNRQKRRIEELEQELAIGVNLIRDYEDKHHE